MRSPKTSLLTVLAAFLLLSPAFAGPFHVDGSWSDWGIDPAHGQWNPSNGQRIFFEDYTGTDGDAYVSPGWGGQFFDVEAIYADHPHSQVYFAIVTGFDPDGLIHRGSLYTAGDIFLDVGNGWTVGIDLSTRGIYVDAVGSRPTFASSTPFEIVRGTLVGTAELAMTSDGVRSVYNGGDRSSRHYLIEGMIDLASIGAEDADARIHWTMSCGNDVGEGDIPPSHTPEPATILMVTLGLAGVGRMAARRGRR